MLGKGSQAWRLEGSVPVLALPLLILGKNHFPSLVFLIAKKMKLLGNVILRAHPVIYRFCGCLARKGYIKLFLPDVKKRALDSERKQLVLALPSWTIVGKSFNLSEPHFCICDEGIIGRMT